MKQIFQQPKLFLLCAFIITCSSSFTQKQFTHTATRANNSCNGDCTLLDIPELNNNPKAIIFVRPQLDKGVNLNPHPIGVYYFKGQWNIFNLDQAAIPAGSKFNVEYVTQEDAKFFQYTIKAENIRKDGSAIIDHASLNNNPGAVFTSFLSWNPDVQRGTTNREQISVQYSTDESKWIISNINQKPLFARVVYNFALTSSGNTTITPTVISNSVQAPATSSTSGQTVSADIHFMYLTSWVNAQKLPGDNILAAHLDKTKIVGYELSVNKLTPTGTVAKSVPYYLTIKTSMGSRAEFQLLDAYMRNNSTEHIIEAYSMNQTGNETLSYTIKFKGANIVGFRQFYDESHTNSNQQSNLQMKLHFNEYKIKFTEIEITNKDGYIISQAVQ